MPETTPQPPTQFEAYCQLLDDRAELRSAIESGLSSEAIAAEYQATIAEINGELDELSVQDGFVESLLSGGDAAAQALDDLSRPVFARRKTDEQLAGLRLPYEKRLEVAASFITEYAVEDPTSERIRTAATKAGITVVAMAAFAVLSPEAEDAAATATTAAATVELAGSIENAFAEADFPVDMYFSPRDAAVLFSSLYRFKDVLAEEGVNLPDYNITNDESAVGEDIAKIRVEALARLGALFQNERLLTKALAALRPDDQRRTLLESLQPMMSGDMYGLLADLIESSKILAVTTVTTSRSGPQIVGVRHVDGRPTPAIFATRPGILAVAEAPVTELAADQPQAAEPAGEPASEGTAWPDIEAIKASSRLRGQNAALADVCLGHLLVLRPIVEALKFPLDGEGFPVSTMGDMLCVSAMVTAVAEARSARVITTRTSNPRIISMREALTATLYRHPLLRSFVAAHRNAVNGIIDAAFAVSQA
jgi:hypothetical protein